MNPHKKFIQEIEKSSGQIYLFSSWLKKHWVSLIGIVFCMLNVYICSFAVEDSLKKVNGFTLWYSASVGMMFFLGALFLLYEILNCNSHESRRKTNGR